MSWRALGSVVALGAVLLGTGPLGGCARSSPESAVRALVAAAREGDRAEVESLLGGRGEQEGGDLGLAEGSTGAGAAGIGGDLQSMSQPRSKDKTYKWGNDSRWVKVTFRDDKVTGGTFKTEQGLK